MTVIAMTRVLMALAGWGLLGQAGAAQPVPENACSGDIEAFCRTVEPGDGRILRCLKEHRDGLSAGCQHTLDAAADKVAELRRTCGRDAIRLCTGALGSGGGAIAQCLQAHQSELSEPCRRGIEDLIGS